MEDSRNIVRKVPLKSLREALKTLQKKDFKYVDFVITNLEDQDTISLEVYEEYKKPKETEDNIPTLFKNLNIEDLI